MYIFDIIPLGNITIEKQKGNKFSFVYDKVIKYKDQLTNLGTGEFIIINGIKKPIVTDWGILAFDEFNS